jgi:hypothetical protein
MQEFAVTKFVTIAALFFAASTSLKAATRSACDLLDAKTAASLVGGNVDAPMDTGFACIYADVSAKTQVIFTLSDASIEDADAYIQSHGGAKQGDTYESIPGLPSKNLFVVTSYQKHSLTVFERGKEVNLIVHRPMSPDLKASMVRAMKRILAQL